MDNPALAVKRLQGREVGSRTDQPVRTIFQDQEVMVSG